jgi:hypothetical protein
VSSMAKVASVVGLLLVAGLLAVGGCGEREFRSQWLDRAVTIDGRPSDWEGRVYTLDGEQSVVGFLNDRSDLYICLASSDPSIGRQVLERGLTLWFDPAGGEDKSFGIRFPLGHAKNGAAPPGGPPDAAGGSPADSGSDHGGDMPAPGDEQAGPEHRRSPDGNRSFFMELPSTSLPDSAAELEIIEGGKSTRLRVSRVPGIAVKVGLKGGTLTYEMRISLARDDGHPYGIGADFARPIGLGLEAPELKQSSGHENRGDPDSGVRPARRAGAAAREFEDDPLNDPSGGSSRDPSTGQPGGMDGEGHRGGMHGPGPSLARRGPMRFWIRVRLAAGDSTGTPAPASNGS